MTHITIDRKILEQVLEELENCADLLKVFKAPVDSCIGAGMLGAENAATTVKEALAQTAQFPVGDLMFLDRAVIKLHVTLNKPDSTTTPPQRKPLTDEELDLILQRSPIQANYGDLVALSRAIEAAHGVKE